jgi:acetoin utilization protein AcuB
MNASAAMTREVITAPPELPLSFVWGTMKEHAFRHLPVVVDGRLVGIISDRDVLLRARLENGRIIVPNTLVGEAMTLAPVTCQRTSTIDTIARLMLERKIDAVPVTDSAGGLVGLVTSSDLLALLINKDPATVLPFDFRLRAVDASGRLAAPAAA